MYFGIETIFRGHVSIMRKYENPIRHLDIYSELCPASSATIIGTGLVTITMGSVAAGFVVVLAGIGVGIAGPLAKSVASRHKH
jgi:hypothetical protein